MIQIHAVQENEILQLRDFMECTFRVAYEKDNEPADFEAYCSEFFSLEKVKSELADENADFWFAKIKNQVVGYFKLKFDLPLEQHNLLKTTKLERIYVSPEFQGRGIGAAMLAAAEDFSAFLKQEFLWLSVWKKNPSAIQFYKKNGYHILGVEIFVVGNDAQEDWLMGKSLSVNGAFALADRERIILQRGLEEVKNGRIVANEEVCGAFKNFFKS